MLSFIVRRLVYMVVVLALISLVSFVIINLPPGSWIETYAYQLESAGNPASAAQLDYIRQRYGLDQPLISQYLRWIVPIVTSLDFGFSFEWQQPVSTLIGDRLLLTVVVSLASLIFVYVVSIATALYSATHQYSLSDYVVSVLGVIGLATPSFLLALILLVLSARLFGITPTGLLSPEYMTAPWSWAKWLDLFMHLPVPVIVVGLAGTAATIRILRSQLLDEFHKQYVTTARAKGLTERKLLFKYPFRMALNPIVSTMGTLLPSIVSGSTIVAIVLGLPTIGPLLLRAIVAQDTYVAASCLMMLGTMTVVGVFLSDILLMVLDPRVRMERSAA
jgi:peptide/nickel transport system permease protein